MRMIIEGEIRITPEVILPNYMLVIEDEHILSLERGIIGEDSEIFRIDILGQWVIPSMIDIHVHGALGCEVMDGTKESLHAIECFFIKHGVTNYITTTISASNQDIFAAIENVSRSSQPQDGVQ